MSILKLLGLQPSYAQDMGIQDTPHGFYGSMINTLGNCIGTLGAVPCFPCPNPYREVQQGEFIGAIFVCSHLTSTVYRIRWVDFTLRTFLQGS